jgi:crotonobetainyl-CoA:carnitine CoA-transferase CaiB-like acyl-CoA transferase
VNYLEDLLHDPHLESVGFWRMVEHPSEGMLRMPANPIEMSASPPSIRRPPPRLGEHTVEVLHSFGFDAAAIERLTPRP